VNDTILVIENDHTAPIGILADELDMSGAEWRQIAVKDGDPFPDTVEWRAIVPLGGEMGAYDEDRFPFLAEEKRFLARAVEAGVPVLGICLGSQLLADALGGRAYRASDTEVGYHPLARTRTDAGRRDEVLGQVEGPFFVWHRDTFDLPPDAELLAASDRYPHAYRVGSALAVQFHPEVTGALIRDWARLAGPERMVADGVEPDELEREIERHDTTSEAAGRELFRAWLARV
jgi:GMP synthase-like glutamine amidotransferase